MTEWVNTVDASVIKALNKKRAALGKKTKLHRSGIMSHVPLSGYRRYVSIIRRASIHLLIEIWRPTDS
jgi:hypothetical protein